MKQRTIIVLLACAAMVVSHPSVVRAEVDISASVQINAPTDFYQPLEPYGSWVDVSSYGRCWRPREVATDWQPYTIGHWEWTDTGWYWASDEPWGWACFHYGSWYQDASYGWVWIPGTDWAPAWVSWRYSDAYIGWAPCGPGRSVLAPSFFTFCDVHRFGDHFRSGRDFVVNNTTIINRTKVVNNFNRKTVNFDGRQRTVFENRGPGVDPIQKATGRTFTPRPVRDVVRESRQPENIRRDDGQRKDTRPEQRRDNTPSPTGREQLRNYQQPDNRNQQRDRTPQVNQAPLQQNRDRATEQQQQKQQQELKTPQTPAQRPEAISPTGREQLRNYQQPAKPQTPTPATPEQRKEVPTPPQRPGTPDRPLPPTGRDEARPPQPQQREVTPAAREPQQVPKPAAPEQHKEVPAPSQRPATPERPLPPTGRQDVRPATPERPTPPAKVPEARPAPPVRQAPLTTPGADGRGRDGRDNRDN